MCPRFELAGSAAGECARSPDRTGNRLSSGRAGSWNWQRRKGWRHRCPKIRPCADRRWDWTIWRSFRTGWLSGPGSISRRRAVSGPVLPWGPTPDAYEADRRWRCEASGTRKAARSGRRLIRKSRKPAAIPQRRSANGWRLAWWNWQEHWPQWTAPRPAPSAGESIAKSRRCPARSSRRPCQYPTVP